MHIPQPSPAQPTAAILIEYRPSTALTSTPQPIGQKSEMSQMLWEEEPPCVTTTKGHRVTQACPGRARARVGDACGHWAGQRAGRGRLDAEGTSRGSSTLSMGTIMSGNTSTSRTASVPTKPDTAVPRPLAPSAYSSLSGYEPIAQRGAAMSTHVLAGSPTLPPRSERAARPPPRTVDIPRVDESLPRATTIQARQRTLRLTRAPSSHSFVPRPLLPSTVHASPTLAPSTTTTKASRRDRLSRVRILALRNGAVFPGGGCAHWRGGHTERVVQAAAALASPNRTYGPGRPSDTDVPAGARPRHQTTLEKRRAERKQIGMKERCSVKMGRARRVEHVLFLGLSQGPTSGRA
ncbi:hypothetical protein C8J57DRAFT_1635691 [Mycena rebaudengoi]|nr:hypothetical protein C8J57DRAFT_1635691 [Mycena rebaudengoi]